MTARQKELAINALLREAAELRRQADDLDLFVVEETPQHVKDQIAHYRADAQEREDAASAIS